MFGKIEDLINDARKYLKYEDNWDGEGSPIYKEETLKRVESFLKLYIKFNKKLPLPNILPGPGGSFDLCWKHLNFDILMNVPEDIVILVILFHH